MLNYYQKINRSVFGNRLYFTNKIHNYIVSLSMLILVLTLSGCMSIGTQFPKANTGYVPKVTYNVTFNKAWGTVVRVLGENSISITSQSKQTGQIITGYMEGATTIGLFNSTSRYKYRIFILKIAQTKTRINISPVLQSGSADSGEFHDVTSFNQGIVGQLKDTLYEKIESALK